MPYLPLIVCLAFAVFFYRSAEVEDESTWIWCGLSILISALTLFWLHWGWLAGDHPGPARNFSRHRLPPDLAGPGIMVHRRFDADK
jgi:hypothetical protein